MTWGWYNIAMRTYFTAGAIIVTRNIKEAKRKVNQIIIKTKSWLDNIRLKLATEKTELIFLTVENRQHDMRQHCGDEKSGQLRWHSTGS